jgi:hypothetical protein
MDEADLVGHANSICLAIADGASLIADLVGDFVDIERLGPCWAGMRKTIFSASGGSTAARSAAGS